MTTFVRAPSPLLLRVLKLQYTRTFLSDPTWTCVQPPRPVQTVGRQLHATPHLRQEQTHKQNQQQRHQQQQQQKQPENPSAAKDDQPPLGKVLNPVAARAAKLRTPEFLHQRYKDGELIPKPLNRPLGVEYPPQPGQNSGVDPRSWRQRRDDFASYEKHKQRKREVVVDLLERNYFRDIGNLGKVHKGKSIIAPSTPFRASLALYFPNLQGQCLAVPFPRSEYRDTTPALRGHVTVVSVVSAEWAADQARSFTSPKENPGLHEFLRSYEPARGLARFATVNVEETWLKAWMVRLCWWNLRKVVPREQWETYYLNRRGFSEELRDALGMWNSKVGYVFLVDGQCRIRWAGNGHAWEQEKKSLVACVRRLVDEARGVQRMRVRREEPRTTGVGVAGANAAAARGP